MAEVKLFTTLSFSQPTLLWCTANTSFLIPKAGHILAKVRATNPNHHFSSLMVHKILRLPTKPQRLCTCWLNLICLSLLISLRPGLIRFVYRQKSGWEVNQLRMVWEQHQSPVAFATLAYDRWQFPPVSFCNASTTASFITLCLAKWSLAFFSKGTLSSCETLSHLSW